jgi:glucokinase
MGVGERRPPFFLGIDLGGTNIKSGVVDDSGTPLSSVSVETLAERGPDVGVMTLAEAGHQAVRASGVAWSEIAGIGLGTPGTMDIQAGLLLDPPNLPGWTNFPVRDRLAALLNRPVTFQNDANAAAYGEYWVGAGKGSRSLVMFTLGTGIGCGIVDHGAIVEGRHSHGAECGHLIVQMIGGREHPPGYFGRLEAYASATALVKRAVEALDAGESSTLAQAHRAGTLTARAIDEAARQGDPLASKLMSDTAKYLAVGATNLMHTIDPDVVLFGGGMIAAGTPFLEQIRAEVRRIAFPVPAARTRIEYAELGNDAGFIGAAGCARLRCPTSRDRAS